ncbi:MAG: hypothetical protein Q8Q26_00330 [Pseudorhodobacter sp.]|nr:hypothetical protein [Pseudorhodobacter sp.]
MPQRRHLTVAPLRVDHRHQRGAPFGMAVGLGQVALHDKPVPVFHQCRRRENGPPGAVEKPEITMIGIRLPHHLEEFCQADVPAVKLWPCSLAVAAKAA